MTGDDAALVERAKQGDQDAVVTLYNQHHPAVFTYLFYRLGDQSAAEDLTADVFVRMVDRLDTYQDKGKPFLAWLYTIARNILIDHQRRASQAVLLSLDEAQDGAGPQDTSQSAERRITYACLRSALSQLTEEQRQVIVLKFVDGRSNTEIGSLLGKPEGAVKSLQHRALGALRRILEDERFNEL